MGDGSPMQGMGERGGGFHRCNEESSAFKCLLPLHCSVRKLYD